MVELILEEQHLSAVKAAGFSVRHEDGSIIVTLDDNDPAARLRLAQALPQGTHVMTVGGLELVTTMIDEAA